MVISNGMFSYCFWAAAISALTPVGTMMARMCAPGVNGPSNLMPNQYPNSFESASARQTRGSGARKKTFFSIRSVFMQPPGCMLTSLKSKCNLRVADATFLFLRRLTAP